MAFRHLMAVKCLGDWCTGIVQDGLSSQQVMVITRRSHVFFFNKYAMNQLVIFCRLPDLWPQLHQPTVISQVLARRLRGVNWKYLVLLCDLRPPARGMGTTTGGSVVVLVGRQVSPAGCCMFELLVHFDTT